MMGRDYRGTPLHIAPLAEGRHGLHAYNMSEWAHQYFRYTLNTKVCSLRVYYNNSGKQLLP